MAWKREFPTEQFADQYQRGMRLEEQDVLDLAAIFTEYVAAMPEHRQGLTIKINDHKAEDVDDLRDPPGVVSSLTLSASIHLRLALAQNITMLSWDTEDENAVAAANKIQQVLSGKEVSKTASLAPLVTNALTVLFGAWIVGAVGWGIGWLIGLNEFYLLIPILGSQLAYGVFAAKPLSRRLDRTRPIWTNGANPKRFVDKHYNVISLLLAALAIVVPVLLLLVPNSDK